MAIVSVDDTVSLNEAVLLALTSKQASRPSKIIEVVPALSLDRSHCSNTTFPFKRAHIRTNGVFNIKIFFAYTNAFPVRSEAESLALKWLASTCRSR